MSVQCNCHRSHLICSTLDIVNESGEPDMLVQINIQMLQARMRKALMTNLEKNVMKA